MRWPLWSTHCGRSLPATRLNPDSRCSARNAWGSRHRSRSACEKSRDAAWLGTAIGGKPGVWRTRLPAVAGGYDVLTCAPSLARCCRQKARRPAQQSSKDPAWPGRSIAAWLTVYALRRCSQVFVDSVLQPAMSKTMRPSARALVRSQWEPPAGSWLTDHSSRKTLQLVCRPLRMPLPISYGRCGPTWTDRFSKRENAERVAPAAYWAAWADALPVLQQRRPDAAERCLQELAAGARAGAPCRRPSRK